MIASPVRLRQRNVHGVPRAGIGARAGSLVPMPYLLLFLTLLLVYVYTPPRWQDWNQNSRFDLTLAIVEQQSVRIDDYVDDTGDYAILDGHAYTDKAPGLSLAAVPVYAATRVAQPLGLSWVTQRLGQSEGFSDTLLPGGRGLSDERVDHAVALYLATIVCVALPAALMLVVLGMAIERLTGCRTAGLLSALIVGLATPVFTYAQAFYGHVPAAAAVCAAWALIVLRPGAGLSDWRLFAVGLLLGLAVLIEYPAALAGLPVALWALWMARGRAVVFGTLGALPPLAVLAIYDLVAFGTPLPIGYEHSALWQEQHDTGFLSLTYPHWDAAWGLSFSAFRGLFFFAPVLLLALPGVWLALRDARQRVPVAVALAGFVAMFAFASSSAMWWGGFAVGPRYIVPAVPFLAVPLGSFIAWANARPLRARLGGLAVVAALAALSSALVWSATFARQLYPPDTTRRPLADYVLPAFREGDLARNLGMAMQLNGIASLVPLLVVVIAGVALIGRSLLVAEAANA